MERDLLDAPAFGIRPHHDLWKHVEVPRADRPHVEDARPIQAKTAREIAERHAETAGKEAVEDAAQQGADKRHRRVAALDVAGRDQDLSLMPPLPEIGDERRRVGEIRVHGEDIASPGQSEAGAEGAAVAGLALHHDRAQASSHGRSRLRVRLADHHQHFRLDPQTFEDRP